MCTSSLSFSEVLAKHKQMGEKKRVANINIPKDSTLERKYLFLQNTIIF